jgi:Protein of unknown function (DUF3305)
LSAAPLARIPVGVVVERRKAKNAWIDFVWRPVAVLPGEPAAAPWTVLKEDGSSATYYAGHTDIELHVSDTTQYRDNLATGVPALWVVLRPTGVTPPYELLVVTADPSEGEAMTEPGTDLVEPVAMPETIKERIAAFVAEYHVDRPFYKRKRDRADPDSMGRKSRVRGSDE